MVDVSVRQTFENARTKFWKEIRLVGSYQFISDGVWRGVGMVWKSQKISPRRAPPHPSMHDHQSLPSLPQVPRACGGKLATYQLPLPPSTTNVTISLLSHRNHPGKLLPDNVCLCGVRVSLSNHHHHSGDTTSELPRFTSSLDLNSLFSSSPKIYKHRLRCIPWWPRSPWFSTHFLRTYVSSNSLDLRAYHLSFLRPLSGLWEIASFYRSALSVTISL